MTDSKDWQTDLYEKVARKSPQIIPLFKYLYFAIILFLILGANSYIKKGQVDQFFYTSGVYFGRTALTLLGIVVLPGILGRFGIEIKLSRIITLFRRQLGILVFVLAFSHYQLVRGISIYTGQIPLFPRPIFEVIGTTALFLMFFMFLTSNNFSQKTLGKNWKRLHRIVYVILWLLVFHTGLQRISIWSVFILTFAVLEVLSWIYFRLKKAGKTSDPSVR
ncbi:MAG TPA: ferric reductase-like transmembrane domain-containing protein, partial [Patescibacteria group bacterium]|nr:ferric reductase-like transmembrane domain-containing protein [Patescibacteria group bacterium]